MTIATGHRAVRFTEIHVLALHGSSEENIPVFNVVLYFTETIFRDT